jgi:hypothetical protein
MEVEDFLAGISRPGLCAIASRYNGGIPCSSDPLTCVPTFGTFNVVIPIVFENGAKWVARIPRPGRMFLHPNGNLLERIMTSMAVTTSVVRNRTSIPVPAIYGWSASDDNEAGCPYMFMDFVEGVSLGDCLRDLPPDKTTSIIYEWAMYTWELTSLQFPAIGCLGPNHRVERIEVQKFLSAGSVDQGRDGINPRFRGPYTTTADYLFGISNLKKNAPVDGQSYDRFSFGTYLESLIPFALKPELEYGPFCVCHDDLNVQNILVDPEEGRITAIIDWDYACVKPLQSLLSYPESLRWDLLAPVNPSYEPYQIEWSRRYRKQWADALALASKTVASGININVRDFLDDSPFYAELERGLGEPWRETGALKFCNAFIYGPASTEILRLSGRAIRGGPWMSMHAVRAGYLTPPDLENMVPPPPSPRRQSIHVMHSASAGGVVKKKVRKAEKNKLLCEWKGFSECVRHRKKRLSAAVDRLCRNLSRDTDEVALTGSEKGNSQKDNDWFSVLGQKLHGIKRRKLDSE